VPKLSNCNVS